MSERGPGRTGGQLFVDALVDAGARYCFGVPGESFLGVLDALVDSPITFVSARHEGGASFMASGYSRVTGALGVCCGTRAVGSANLAIGIHNARQDSTPMLAFAGQVNRSFVGREAFQEVDLVAAMAPLTKWAVHLASADAVPEVMARAINIATSGRPGPVFVSIAQDVCDESSAAAPRPPATIASPAPDPAAVTAILDALGAAERPVLFAGGGTVASPGAHRALIALAEALEVPVITGWRHHDAFPNDHRLFLGSASLGASPVVFDRLGEADVVVVVGNRMQENGTDGYRFPLETTRLFQIDIDPDVMVNHRSPELGLVADAGAALRALLDAAPTDAPGAATRRAQNAEDRERYLAAVTLPEPLGSSGVAYPHVVRTLREVLPDEGIVSTDAGNFYAWLSRYFPFRAPRTYVGPASGAMGYGLPAAIGAKLAAPGVPVISVSGDGGFLMTMAELETAVRYDIGVVALVLDNSRHGTIRMHQERQHPGRVIGTDLGTTDLRKVAEGLGAAGFLVERDADLEPALRAALGAGGPALVQVRMDRDQLSVGGRLPSA